jgi:hypothetical protein
MEISRRKMKLEVAKLEREERDYWEKRGYGSDLIPLSHDSGMGLPGIGSRARSPKSERPATRLRIEPILELPSTRSAINQLQQNPLKPDNMTIEFSEHREPKLY